MRIFIFCLATAVTLSGLAVDSTHAANSDENRAQQIAGDLKQSGKLKDYRVGVKYEDGVAWLTGAVTSGQQRQIAEEVARQSPGVTHVVNKLEVENSGLKTEATESAEATEATESKMAESRKPEVARSRQANFQQRPMAAQQRRPIARRPQAKAPRNNMPVPYASAGRQGVRPAAYSRQAQFCPDGSCMTGAGGMQGGGGRRMQPNPMRGGGPGAGGQAVNYDNPQMPGYAWPSYAASSNYAALTYPKQYSASAWPYIGPFYPYPQVPLGWRKVTLEWDDGWWFLDFKDK